MLNVYKLEQQIEMQMEAGHVPGLAIAIVQDQGVIYARGFGITSVEDGGLPVTPQTLFRIGSVTKPLLGTAVMRLVEAGRLELDQPIKEYINWIRFSQKDAEECITLRMLLSHTAGLPSDSRDDAGDPDGLERYVREQIPRYSFVAPPGRLYSYSNCGFNLIGYIAQTVSGRRFPDLMQELVFDPLEMKHTTFDPRLVLTYPFALPHILNDGMLNVLHRISESCAYAPSGQAYSTVLDLANFAMLHLQYGRFREKQLLSTQSVLEMQKPHTNRYTVNDSGYGLSFETMTYKGVDCFGHSGSMSTFGCQLMTLPEKKLALVLMVSRIAFMKRLVGRIMDHLLDMPREHMKPLANKPDRSSWSNYTGAYLGMRAGLAIISIENDQLVLELNGQHIPLEAHSHGVYFGYCPGSDTWCSVGFVAETTGPVCYIMIDERLCERFEHNFLFSPDPAYWRRYSGTYRENGNNETIDIRVEDHGLVLRLHDNDASTMEGTCIPLDENRFAWSGGLIEFEIADDGTVPALTAMQVYRFGHVFEPDPKAARRISKKSNL